MTDKDKKLDSETTIDDLRVFVNQFVEERQWKSYHTPKALAEAISIEAAELLECFLFKPEGYCPENLEHLTEEMADIFVYLISLCNTLNLESFSEIVHQKMKKNRSKYPIERYAGDKYQKQ